MAGTRPIRDPDPVRDKPGSPAVTEPDPPTPEAVEKKRHSDGLEATMPATPSKPVPDVKPPSTPTVSTERYRLGAELGRGGMGRVVEAFDTQLGRTVALKEVLPPKTPGGTHRRFAREVKLTARLEHPSIVPLYDSGIGPDGRPFYVMRRVTGRPLDELIARAHNLSERLTLIPRVLAAIEAVAHAHERGIIHRDIKPQNILVGELGETVVIDWGLAKVVGEDETLDSTDSQPPSAADSLRTQIGSVFGTPGFMAPEQARGEELGTQGDVYALGAVLYHLLCGTPPHSGISATEVIEKTSKHEVKPLDHVAPGAPPDLVAIVGKALALDREKRYPNAGALAEDVRRFLDGQLVAAHNYTKRQRLARFVRRHRAALSTLAAATVVVAVMAWIGVHRIITERDAANEAHLYAEQQRRAAEDTRDKLAERRDQLVVSQARAKLESNPTEALAVLKQIEPTSRRLGDAMALAQAAVTRGVAWAQQTTQVRTNITALDPTGTRLLQISMDGMVRVWDLERHRLVIQRPYAKDTYGVWVSGGKVLVTNKDAPPQLLDPTLNTSEPLSIDPIPADAMASERGDRVVYHTREGKVYLFDAAKRATAEVPFTGEVVEAKISPDGNWLALATKKELVVTTTTGVEITRHAGETHFVTLDDRRLAVVNDQKVFECKLDPTPTWTEVQVPLPPHDMVGDLIYRGKRLAIRLSFGEILEWNGKATFQRTRFEGSFSGGMVVVNGNTLIVPAMDGKLNYFNDVTEGSIAFPASMKEQRIVGRRTGSRLAVSGIGILLGYDLAPVVPQVIEQPSLANPTFVDDDTLLVQHNMDWYWLDIRTGRQVAIDHDSMGIAQVGAVEPSSGRALIRETSPRGMRLFLVEKNKPQERLIVEGRDAWGALIPGNAIVYGVGDGRMFEKRGTTEAHEIVKLDGVADFATPLGYLRYAAHSSTGEVVRGDLGSAKLERTHVQVGSANSTVINDNNGHVLISEDNRLLLWDAAVTELAKFDKPIMQLGMVEGGAVLVLSDMETRFVELAPGATQHRLLAASKFGPRASLDGKLVVGQINGNRAQIVEMPSRSRWDLPPLIQPNERVLDVAPTARLVVQSTMFHFAIWHLPHTSSDYNAWLDSFTNATVDDDGVLTWPWQSKRSP